jgi:phosphopantothenoylcysteine decarboxylase/phosphopantothenate--cysteine ligase
VRILVTAGPTREPIDDVRYLSNPSSGRMGYALARAAAERGHATVLITGPTSLEDPAGIEVRVDVRTTDEMLRAVLDAFPRCDALIMAAAPVDYRIKERIRGKLKKADREIDLRFVRNPDILERVAEIKEAQVVIGFAMEVARPRWHAREKLRRKRLDYVVLNGPESFGGRVATVEIIGPGGVLLRLDAADKETIAREIVGLCEREAAARDAPS